MQRIDSVKKLLETLFMITIGDYKWLSERTYPFSIIYKWNLMSHKDTEICSQQIIVAVKIKMISRQNK